jgi:hypothetical protein
MFKMGGKTMDRPYLVPSQQKESCPLVITNGEEFRLVNLQRRYLLKVKSDLDRLITAPINPESRLRSQALEQEIAAYTARIDRYLNARSLAGVEEATFDISILQTLPATLLQARLARGITLRALEERIGINISQLSRYESTNYQYAPLPRIIVIAEAIFNWQH